MNSAVSPQVIWQEHVTGAVRAFLKTAVVIDNQPSLGGQTQALQQPLQASGIDDDTHALAEPESVVLDDRANILDVRSITDSFINEGIACAFLMPEDEVNDDGAKIARALKAAKISDVVVIDWFLKGTDTSLTLQILQQIAEHDKNENGRLRLVCVYTGQSLNDQIFTDILSAFDNGGVTLQRVEEESFCAVGENTVMILLNKVEVPTQALPNKIIKSFTKLADGVMPSFALAAVGAVRKNVHHLVTRFSKKLDSAYLSNRLITNPPNDVAELMRELLVAEFDSAIGTEKVADNYLYVTPLQKWLHTNASSFVTQPNGSNPIDTEFLKKLLNSFLDNCRFSDADGNILKLPDNRKELISVALAGDSQRSTFSQNEFSRLVLFKREACAVSSSDIATGWQPTLTTGSLLKKSDGRYFVCFTPACDTLRLTSASSFVFLEAIVVTEGYNIVLNDLSGDRLLLRFECVFR